MRERPISELAEVNPALTVHLTDATSVSFVSMADVSESGRLLSHRPRPFGEVKTGLTRFQNGDVLFAKITPCMENGKGAIAQGLENGVGCGSTEFHVLRARGDNDARYLHQLLQWETTRQKAKLYMSGSAGQQRVPADFFQKFETPAPAPAAQKRVASVLTSIDIAIERTEALIAKHQRIKVGLMQDLFTRGVLPNGQLRPPHNEVPELYQETAVGWIPSDWQLTGLQAKSHAGISWIRTGPFGSALKGEHWRTHGHPVITIGALGEGEFLDEELLFVDGRDAARLRDFQLSAGDVVFSRVADVGRSVVIREQHAGWIMSSNLMRIALDPNQARPDYLQMQLAGDSRIKAQIRAQVNSGGRDVANSAVLSRLRFAWPDPNEQDRIISRVLVHERALQAERRKAEKLQKQKLGLMQDLLTGRVSVDHLVSEPVDA